MKKIIIQKLDSNIVKFQTKIKNNFQLYCFSRDSIIHFSKFHKSGFKDYEFLNFSNKFKNVSVKNTLENIKHTKIIDYGNDLIEKKLTNLVFVLNMSDFEAWLFEFLNQVFSNDHKILLRYLNPEKGSFELSLLEQSKNIEEVWQGQEELNPYLRFWRPPFYR